MEEVGKNTEELKPSLSNLQQEVLLLTSSLPLPLSVVFSNPFPNLPFDCQEVNLLKSPTLQALPIFKSWQMFISQIESPLTFTPANH